MASSTRAAQDDAPGQSGNSSRGLVREQDVNLPRAKNEVSSKPEPKQTSNLRIESTTRGADRNFCGGDPADCRFCDNVPCKMVRQGARQFPVIDELARQRWATGRPIEIRSDNKIAVKAALTIVLSLNPSEILTTEEAAVMYGCSKNTVREKESIVDKGITPQRQFNRGK